MYLDKQQHDNCEDSDLIINRDPSLQSLLVPLYAFYDAFHDALSAEDHLPYKPGLAERVSTVA